MSFQTQVLYDVAGHFSFDTSLVEQSGSVVRLKDLGAGTYSTANPTVTTQHQIMASVLSTFAESKTVAGSDQVKYCLVINGVDYWYNTSTSTWEASDGTYAKSNTGTEINANLSTLNTHLSITLPFYVRLKVFLHSNDGTTRPSLTSNTFTHTFITQSPVTISECLIFAYLSDLLGDAYSYDATKPVKLHARTSRDFFHGNKLIRNFSKSATFNSSGYVELSLIETETPGIEVEFFITYYENVSGVSTLKQLRLNNAMVPNTSTRALSVVTTVSAGNL